MKNKYFVWILPILWAGCSLLSFRFPGDEYAMYGISSIAGVWIVFFISLDIIHNPMFPVSIALTGAIVMMILGFLMDLIKIRKAMWKILFPAAVIVIFVISIKAYPTIERALRKNGSWWTYIFFSINMGLYFSILLSFIGKGIETVWLRTRRKMSN